jgi:hypothetical protein
MQQKLHIKVGDTVKVLAVSQKVKKEKSLQLTEKKCVQLLKVLTC